MKKRKVLVAIFDQCQVLDLSGPVEALEKANIALTESCYEVSLVAAKTGKVKTSGLLEFYASRDYASISASELNSLDTFIVVGGKGVKEALNDKNLLKLIKLATKKARRVVSVCSGAFLLAEAGLLNGRRATTHWENAHDFETRYPQVQLEIDAIYLRDGKFWTSAGITAGIDLTLALIEEDHGKQIALNVARQLVVYMMRSGGQAQFSTQLKLQQSKDSQFRQLVEWVAENPNEDLCVTRLASRCSMSERNFTRRFTQEMNISPARFVELSRLDFARRKLEETDLALQQISDLCGFKSVEVMRRLFKRKLCLSPMQYRYRFRTSLRSIVA